MKHHLKSIIGEFLHHVRLDEEKYPGNARYRDNSPIQESMG